jgi:hypothetical protein
MYKLSNLKNQESRKVYARMCFSSNKGKTRVQHPRPYVRWEKCQCQFMREPSFSWAKRWVDYEKLRTDWNGTYAGTRALIKIDCSRAAWDD